MANDVFFIKACRCARCGGLLTSQQAINDGMGHVCKIRSEQERKANEPDPDQLRFDEIEEIRKGDR